MSEHALISPSSASRWLVCTPSARVESTLPENNSADADEGTLAHSLSDLLINRALFRIRKEAYLIKLKEIQASEYYSKGMLKYCQGYKAFVLNVYAKALKIDSKAEILIEIKLDLSRWIPESFGTADVLIACSKWIWFIDLKYGMGVRVEAKENKQLMCYGLGALSFMELFYSDIKEVFLSIYQPRIDNISTYELLADDLLKWGKDKLRPIAKRVWAGEGEYVAGDHCMFCRAKPQCKANAQYRLQLGNYKFKAPELLTPEEISDVLTRYDGLVNWAKSVEEYALREALKGMQWPGWKIVASRGNRKFKDIKKAAAIAMKAGYSSEEIYKPQEMRGITELEALMGKDDFAFLFKSVIAKPYGNPSLAPESSDKPAYSKTLAAKQYFQ